MISIRSLTRLTQYNLGNPTGLPATRRIRSGARGGAGHDHRGLERLGQAWHALGGLEGDLGAETGVIQLANGLHPSSLGDGDVSGTSSYADNHEY